MPLWGNLDYNTSNGKPIFANTSNAHSNSSIHGTAANSNTYYGHVVGVSPGEMANNTTYAVRPGHAGWVSLKVGTGPVTNFIITGNGVGTGVNANGYILLSDNSILGQGAGFNASFVIANTGNLQQNYSTNSSWNVIASITINSGGYGFSNAKFINVRTNGANTTYPGANITPVLGGRAERISTEVLVAMGSITGDDPRDNVYFSGI